jgi:tetratricopeptide (TPR) repeat protein
MPLKRSSLQKTTDNRVGVLWEGSFFVHHSLANVNCELACALATMGVDLGLIPYEAHQFDESVDPRFRVIAERLHHQPARVDCHVRHQWPPNFERPARGAFVLMQPWEFGSLPADWVEGIARSVDEVWAYSNYVKDVYLRSGVDPSKVQTIPLGVNPELFNAMPNAQCSMSNAPVSDIGHCFKFLFIGGSIPRKGFDVLLQAYTEEFSADEEVCLVIKDFFYGGQGAEVVKAAQQRPNAPRIVYWYGNTPANQLGSLYKACDAYVQPFRGEGMGLPILEAMACGLPVIVTDYGPTKDYCSAETAYLVAAREVEIPPEVWGNQFKTVQPPMWAEPDKDALRAQMRHVFSERDAAKQKGQRASQHILSHYTWKRTATQMVERFKVWKERFRERKQPASVGHAVANRHAQSAETAEICLQNGQRNLAAGDVAAAAAQFRRAAELQPRNAVAHNSLAFALFSLQQFDEALRHAQQAADVDPHYAEAHHNIGALLLNRGNLAEAAQHLTRALELKPVYPEAAQMLAELLPSLGRGVSRRERREQARKKRQTSAVATVPPHVLEAAQQALTQSRREIQAIADDFRVREKPQLSLCMIVKDEEKFLAQCLDSVQDVADEIVIVDTGSTDGTLPIAQRFGAKVFHYEWNNDFSAARNAALQHATGDWVLVLDADERLEPNDKPKLLEAMRFAAQPAVNIGGYALPFRNYIEGEESGPVIMHYATRLFRNLPGVAFSGLIHEEATPSIYGLGMQIAFANVLIHHYGYNRNVVDSRNKMERTYTLLFKQLEKEPDNPFHLYNLANTYQYDGKWEDALPYFEKAVALMKAEAFYAAAVYNGWATCLYCLKRYPEAVDKCLTSLRASPDHPETHYNLGLNYNALQRYDEAIEQFEKAIALGKTFSIGISDLSVSTYKAHFAIGQAYMGKRDNARAIESLRRALEIEPQFMPAQFHLGVALSEAGHVADAIQSLEAVLSSQPTHLEACEHLAHLYAQRGRGQDAIAFYERLLQQKPDCEAAHCNLGNLLNSLGERERAIHHYRRALALNPHRAETHNNLGVSLARCGDLTGAEEHYLTALRLNPRYAEAHGNLGVLRCEQGDWDGALRAFQRAIADKPDYVNAYLNMGDALRRCARLEEALQCYEKAATLHPQHALPFFKIGRLYLECNAPQAGILALQHAVQLDPHFTDAREQLAYATAMLNSPSMIADVLPIT